MQFKQLFSRRFLTLVVFLAASFLTYFNALKMDFIGDDVGRILMNPNFVKDFETVMSTVVPDRPVAVITFWLNHQLGGFDVVGYKIVNLLLHGLVGFLFFLLLTDLSPALKKNYWLALATGVLFCVHPLNNQAINSVVQRGVLLCSLFSLVALRMFVAENLVLKKRIIVLLILLLAILSKWTALAIPPLFVAFEWIVRRKSLNESFRNTWIYFLIYAIPPLYYFVGQVSNQVEILPWHEYFLVQTRVLFLYFRLFLVPTDLHFLYDINSGAKIFENLTWLAILGHACIGLGIAYLAKRDHRLLAFALIGVYICLLPESSIFSIRHLAFEHRTYLSLGFFIVALAIALADVSIKALRLVVGAFSALAVVYAVMNLNYNSRISTHEKWASYNYLQNKKSSEHILSELNFYFSSQADASGLEFVELVLKDRPNDLSLETYRKIFMWPKQSSEWQQKFLEELFGILTNPVSAFDHYTRNSFNMFYGRKIRKVLNGPAYPERIVNLLAPQMRALRLGGGINANLFLNYQGNLLMLVQYFNNYPPKNLDFQAFVLLALKFDFGINDTVIDQQLSNLPKDVILKAAGKKVFAEFGGQCAPPLPLSNASLE